EGQSRVSCPQCVPATFSRRTLLGRSVVERDAGFGTNSHPAAPSARFHHPWLATNSEGFCTINSNWSLMAAARSRTPPSQVRKKLLLDCDKHVLGIDNLQATVMLRRLDRFG